MSPSFGVFSLIVIMVQFGVVTAIIISLVMLVKRLGEISKSQQSIAESQAELVRLLASNDSLKRK